jgi:nicotinate-nucleotide adenylyltransferase
MAQRIILFGGTFDPVHLGHTTVVEHASAQLRADKVIFVPARRSPHKSDSCLAPIEHRLNMLALAVADRKSFSISTCEVERSEPSYTFDTVTHFRTKSPRATLFWLVGADIIPSLPRWYRIAELLEICNVCVMSRGGIDSSAFDQLVPALGQAAAGRLRQNAIATPLIPISSTEVRTRLAAGQDVSDMLHPPVLQYIRQHALYGTPMPR